MRKEMLVLLLLAVSGCDYIRGRDAIPRTALSEREFIEVYVELARTRGAEERQKILEQHGTSERELKAFVRAYARNPAALSTVFDSIVARTGSEPERRVRELPPMLEGR